MDKLLLSSMEAAVALNISVDILERIRDSGILRAVNIGSRVYFSPDELKAFVTKEGPIDVVR